MNAATFLFGDGLAAFLILTVFMGGCAAMAGQALARTWRPGWHLLPYTLLLAGTDRFLSYALFQGEFLSRPSYVRDAILLFVLGQLAYRATRASQITVQYPWLYKRTGLFSWKDRGKEP